MDDPGTSSLSQNTPTTNDLTRFANAPALVRPVRTGSRVRERRSDAGLARCTRPNRELPCKGERWGVLDKVKVAAGQATTKAQEGVATLQTKRKLTHAYGELGQTTFELVQSGELTHPRLSPTVERISAIKEELERAKRTEGPPSSASAPGTSPESPTLPAQ